MELQCPPKAVSQRDTDSRSPGKRIPIGYRRPTLDSSRVINCHIIGPAGLGLGVLIVDSTEVYRGVYFVQKILPD